MLPDRGELVDELERAGVEVLARPLSVLRRELMNPAGLASVTRALARDARSLRALIHRRGVALVHSNTSVVLGGAAAAAAARVPHVWHVREIYSRFGRAWPAYRRILETAASLPCVSTAAAAQFGASRRVRLLHDGLAIDSQTCPAPRGSGGARPRPGRADGGGARADLRLEGAGRARARAGRGAAARPRRGRRARRRALAGRRGSTGARDRPGRPARRPGPPAPARIPRRRRERLRRRRRCRGSVDRARPTPGRRDRGRGRRMRGRRERTRRPPRDHPRRADRAPDQRRATRLRSRSRRPS